jgi:membrane-associated phospholipid phosphatase
VNFVPLWSNLEDRFLLGRLINPLRSQIPELPDETRPALRPMLLLTALFSLLGMLVMPADVWVVRFATEIGLPGDLHRVLTWSEAFAHGIGVGVIALCFVILDAARRRFWPRILLTAYLGGLLANGIKFFVVRLRPSAYLPQSGGDSSLFESFTTFRGVVPSLTPHMWEGYSSHAIQSFPSGHTATGVAFACALWAVYPGARWLWVGLALLAALQRIDAMAHYPSDVFAGAAVGCLSAAVFTCRHGQR